MCVFNMSETIKENIMAFNEPAPNFGLSDKGKFLEVIDDHLSLISGIQSDSVADIVFEILDKYAITLDVQSYPASLYAESLLYMVYWFHRLRDPARKKGIEICIGKY